MYRPTPDEERKKRAESAAQEWRAPLSQDPGACSEQPPDWLGGYHAPYSLEGDDLRSTALGPYQTLAAQPFHPQHPTYTTALIPAFPTSMAGSYDPSSYHPFGGQMEFTGTGQTRAGCTTSGFDCGNEVATGFGQNNLYPNWPYESVLPGQPDQHSTPNPYDLLSPGPLGYNDFSGDVTGRSVSLWDASRAEMCYTDRDLVPGPAVPLMEPITCVNSLFDVPSVPENPYSCPKTEHTLQVPTITLTDHDFDKGKEMFSQRQGTDDAQYPNEIPSTMLSRSGTSDAPYIDGALNIATPTGAISRESTGSGQ